MAAASARRLIIVYDRKLLNKPYFVKWLKRFSYTLAVKGGESFKDLANLPKLVGVVLPMTVNISRHDCAIVAVGGGSIGDGAGFLASVIKRGIGLVHIPSTWLAAVDSAHGGKTAMNVGKFKNQIGTFYPARAVFFIKEMLFGEPEKNLISGFGEAQKMALLTGGALYHKINSAPVLNAKLLWSLLPELARAKMHVVEMDLYENSGRRMILNLGHTYGHAIELCGGPRHLSHGEAVRIGLEFAMRFSEQKGLMSKRELNLALAFLDKNPATSRPKISKKELLEAVANDKKAASGGRVRFVFLKKPGRPITKEVRALEIYRFAKIIGWCK